MTIVITSKREGFRRCGMAHPAKPTCYPDDFFTEEQLDALDKEPQLILAYRPGEADLVKDSLNEALSENMPPQTPGPLPTAEPQAPETITAPVADLLASADATILGNGQPGADDLGADGPDQVARDGQAADPAHTSAQAPSVAGTPAKPAKTRATKPKDASK